MVTPGQVYAAIVILLLFVTLGLGLRVLKRIFLEGLERRRKMRAGELERYAEDEEYGRGPSDALEEADGRPYRTCRQCGAENDPEFTYCRRCVAPL